MRNFILIIGISTILLSYDLTAQQEGDIVVDMGSYIITIPNSTLDATIDFIAYQSTNSLHSDVFDFNFFDKATTKLEDEYKFIDMTFLRIWSGSFSKKGLIKSSDYDKFLEETLAYHVFVQREIKSDKDLVQIGKIKMILHKPGQPKINHKKINIPEGYYYLE